MDLGTDASLLSVVLPSKALADDVASTCPLLTPSPPTNALVDPHPEPSESPIPAFLVGNELANKLNAVQDDTAAAESSSSNSSILAEPACTQLLNSHHYVNLTKKGSEGSVVQENGGSLQLTFKKSAEDMYFINWNWPLIRKFCGWMMLSCLVAACALVVAMVWTLPKKCNPEVAWYQGSLFYEVFPASFEDSNNDGIGDLRGLASKVDYIKKLGVRAIRLNSIFPAERYLEHFDKNITTLFDVDPSIGNLDDIEYLSNETNLRNISLILDLPIFPLVSSLQPIRYKRAIYNKNETDSDTDYIFGEESPEFSEREETVSAAIRFWLSKGVDGFYLKGLEKYVNDPFFGESLQYWKQILGGNRCLIVDNKVLNAAPYELKNTLLALVDLVDVRLDFNNGTDSLKRQIEVVQNGSLWSKPSAPWVHWSVGNVDSERLSSTLTRRNATLGATLLQMMLPGTPSIFYGDEIGLQEISDPDGGRTDLHHIHYQLSAMAWENVKRPHRNVFLKHSGHADFTFKDAIAKMVVIRMDAPSIYVNAIWKEGKSSSNTAIKYCKHEVIVLERWYPRRNSFVCVSNLGPTQITIDLSTFYYSGNITVGPRPDSESEKISFKSVSLWAGESVIVKLDK